MKAVWFYHAARAQDRYTLTYLDSAKGTVAVEIEPAQPLTSPLTLVMPRGIPGLYSLVTYDRYVVSPIAITTSGKEMSLAKSAESAPRWTLPDSGVPIKGIRYEVDIRKMERLQLNPQDASIIRPGYVGLLNYSVFGWIDGREHEKVNCSIKTFAGWPIYSTISPQEARGSFQFSCNNYYQLADGQTLIGPAFQAKRFDGPVPAYVVSYTEGKKEYIDDHGWQVVASMKLLKDYFGDLPFEHYTLMRQNYRLLEEHAGHMAMEHLNSSTFFGDLSFAQTKPDTVGRRRILEILHHMGHAYFPLRVPSDRYKPHVEEFTATINSIWFNEGFMWYLCADTLGKMFGARRTFENMQRNLDKADANIKNMSLMELSQVGSTQYGADLRIGIALIARGMFMADEMDAYIRKNTANKKSMRHVLRYFYAWSKKNQRAFTLEEFTVLIKQATGVDVSAIYQKWQKPMTDLASGK